MMWRDLWKLKYRYAMTEIYRITTIEKGKKWNRLVQNLSDYDCLEQEIANPKERFDYYIKQSLIDGSPYLPGLFLDGSKSDNFGLWISKYKRFYDRYLSLSLDIRNRLSKEIYSRYDKGMGNEFKNGKFYSVASSRRFATASISENIGGTVSLVKEISINGQKKKCVVSLEKDLYVYTTGGQVISSPQMDIVVETDEDVYFIEVKCHEIFDDHEKVKIKWNYMEARELQHLLHFRQDSSRYASITKKEGGKDVDYIGIDGELLTSLDFGRELELKTHHFDFKQFLCHLMGICDYCPSTEKKVHFYYLFYKNTQYIEEESAKIYTELEEELSTIFSHYRKMYPNIDFGAMYNNQFDTLESISHLIG